MRAPFTTHTARPSSGRPNLRARLKINRGPPLPLVSIPKMTIVEIDEFDIESPGYLTNLNAADNWWEIVDLKDAALFEAAYTVIVIVPLHGNPVPIQRVKDH